MYKVHGVPGILLQDMNEALFAMLLYKNLSQLTTAISGKHMYSLPNTGWTRIEVDPVLFDMLPNKINVQKNIQRQRLFPCFLVV